MVLIPYIFITTIKTLSNIYFMLSNKILNIFRYDFSWHFSIQQKICIFPFHIGIYLLHQVQGGTYIHIYHVHLKHMRAPSSRIILNLLFWSLSHRIYEGSSINICRIYTYNTKSAMNENLDIV